MGIFRKLSPWYKRYILSDREVGFILRQINFYSENSDRREQEMAERITKVLNGGRR